jgi:hypothetical protein
VIQLAVVGDSEAALQAAKKGLAVLGVEPELETHVAKVGGTFVLFGRNECKLSVVFDNPVDAASKMVDSADMIIIGKGRLARLVKDIASMKDKPYVEGKGLEAVEKAKEKLVRFNLFGVKA